MLAFSGMHRLQDAEFWQLFVVDLNTQTLVPIPVPSARDCIRPLWSPDRQQLAFTAAKREINGTSSVYLFRRAAGTIQQLTHEVHYLSALGWTPDSQALLMFEPHGTTWFLSVVDVATAQIHQLVEITDWLQYTWSSTWDQLAYVPKDDATHIYLSERNGANPRCLITEQLPGVSDLTWSPNGRYLAFTTYEDETIALNTIDLHTNVRQRFENVAYEVQYAWAPTSRYIAYIGVGQQGFALFSVSVPEGVTTYLADMHTGDESGEIRPTNPVWSRDGEDIVFSTFDPTYVFQLYRIHHNGGPPHALLPKTPTFELLYDLAWY